MNDISIPYFEFIMDGLINKENTIYTCHTCSDCSMYVCAIDLKGNFHPCNHFCGDLKNTLGNISVDNLIDLIKRNPFKNRWEKLKSTECAGCDIANLCCGGCPYHTKSEIGNSNGKDVYCEANRIIVRHIHKYIEEWLGK